MEEELIQHRHDKLARIRARGDNPFKYTFTRSCCIAEARETFEANEANPANSGPTTVGATLAGRVTAMRTQGKVTFADIRDSSGKIQLFIKQNTVGHDAYDALKDLDLGDFVGARGNVQRTKMGEITLFVEQYELLTKSLRALPEKYHGLTDVETRYRQRYLDMVANPEVIDVITRRITMIEVIRQFLIGRGFLEVETPILHPVPGGATARPFITHHNTYHRDLYLRIAPELYLKRLIVGGFEKVFEINRNFRNEGVDKTHNPEFTMLELYEAYQDYRGLMEETEELFCAAIEGVCGGLEINYQGSAINAARPWKRLALFESIREFAGIDLEAARDRDTAAALAKKAGVEIKPDMGYGKIVDEVMSLRVKPKLIQPTFLYDYPIEISPLAKKHRDNPALTERYQVFIGGMELCNAFSELNDPIDQRERFEQQLLLREKGDQEAQQLDEDFLTALEIGMPPTAGLGIGIDRLAMLLTDSPSIRDVIIFPQLRPIQQP